jgi:hypothetical protein
MTCEHESSKRTFWLSVSFSNSSIADRLSFSIVFPSI